MYTCKSYDELENIINAWLNGDSDENMNSDTGTERGNTSSSSNESNSSSQKKSYTGNIDDAFADLAAEFDGM